MTRVRNDGAGCLAAVRRTAVLRTAAKQPDNQPREGKAMLHALIMAGGGGTRFWPRSRQKRPKQFLTLSGERTLLQQALDRIEASVPPQRSWVITAGVHRDEASRQLPALPGDRVICEP